MVGKSELGEDPCGSRVLLESSEILVDYLSLSPRPCRERVRSSRGTPFSDPLDTSPLLRPLRTGHHRPTLPGVHPCGRPTPLPPVTVPSGTRTRRRGTTSLRCGHYHSGVTHLRSPGDTGRATTDGRVGSTPLSGVFLTTPHLTTTESRWMSLRRKVVAHLDGTVLGVVMDRGSVKDASPGVPSRG